MWDLARSHSTALVQASPMTSQQASLHLRVTWPGRWSSYIYVMRAVLSERVPRAAHAPPLLALTSAVQRRVVARAPIEHAPVTETLIEARVPQPQQQRVQAVLVAGLSHAAKGEHGVVRVDA